MSATEGALMGFDEWSTQQSQQGDAQRAAQAERQARDLAEAERIIAALEEQLRSVVPHLAAFPRVSVCEQRVDVDSAACTAEVVGIGPATEAWEFPFAAYSEPRYWVDVHGRLWHEAYVHATFDRPRQPSVRTRLDPTASAAVAIPFNAGMTRQRWPERSSSALTCEVRVDGARVPVGTRTVAGVHLSETQTMDFYDTGTFTSHPAVHLDGRQDIGWSAYDSYPTMVRDDVFRRVRAALDRGATTL